MPPAPKSMPMPLRQPVRDLVVAALHVDPPARETFIREGSRGDEALSDEALRILQEICAGAGDAADGDRLRQALDALDPSRGNEDSIVHDFAGTPRFEIRQRLGAGGFGTVYESYDREQKHLIALKVLRRREFVDRFKREFRALVDIRHPNLVHLYELFCEEPPWFFTMELVRGVNFLRFVGQQRPTQNMALAASNLDRLRNAVRQLAQGFLRYITPESFIETSSLGISWCPMADWYACWTLGSCAKPSALANTASSLALPDIWRQSSWRSSPQRRQAIGTPLE
jgi:hypothetical protein